MCSSDCFLAIIAILFPPLPVWIKRGLCSADSVINIALCVLGFIPGLIHSWYIITATPDEYYTDGGEYQRVSDAERGQVNVYYVRTDQATQDYGATSGTSTTNQQQYSNVTSSTNATQSNSNANTGHEVPPSYADAVKTDHKVQGP